jgi:hypothetical protein
METVMERHHSLGVSTLVALMAADRTAQQLCAPRTDHSLRHGFGDGCTYLHMDRSSYGRAPAEAGESEASGSTRSWRRNGHQPVR